MNNLPTEVLPFVERGFLPIEGLLEEGSMPVVQVALEVLLSLPVQPGTPVIWEALPYFSDDLTIRKPVPSSSSRQFDSVTLDLTPHVRFPAVEEGTTGMLTLTVPLGGLLFQNTQVEDWFSDYLQSREQAEETVLREWATQRQELEQEKQRLGQTLSVLLLDETRFLQAVRVKNTPLKTLAQLALQLYPERCGRFTAPELQELMRQVKIDFALRP